MIIFKSHPTQYIGSSHIRQSRRELQQHPNTSSSPQQFEHMQALTPLSFCPALQNLYNSLNIDEVITDNRENRRSINRHYRIFKAKQLQGLSAKRKNEIFIAGIK